MISSAFLSRIAPRPQISFARAKTVWSIVSGTPESVTFSFVSDSLLFISNSTFIPSLPFILYACTSG